jgi:hypothetical protein
LLRLRAPVALRIGTNTTAKSPKNLENHTESFEAAENILLFFFFLVTFKNIHSGAFYPHSLVKFLS